jgi:hypothetical protein
MKERMEVRVKDEEIVSLECPGCLPFLYKNQEILKRNLKQNIAVMGTCLSLKNNAQLLKE